MYQITSEQLKDLYENYYNSKMQKTEIANKTKIDRHTISKYFKLFEEGQYENLYEQLQPIKNSFTDLQFIEAVNTSISIRQAISKLGLTPAGGNYKQFHKNIKRLELDTSHFTGMDLTGRKLPQRRLPIEEYLKVDTNIQSHKLKIYLIENKTFEHKCYKCNLTVWNEKPIPLELEHINGINNDNRLENLTLLCPNCHAQTDTYRGKNIKTKKVKLEELIVLSKEKPLISKPKNNCLVCNKDFEIKTGCLNNYCSRICTHKAQQKNEYSVELITNLLVKHKGNMSQASKEVKLADNGLKKWCIKYNLNPKDYK